MQDLAETYRTTSDDDLIRLHADISNLTQEAREALSAEINRRGLAASRVAAREEQWKQEAEEDAQVEQEKRKRPVPWLRMLTQLGISVAFVALFAALNVAFNPRMNNDKYLDGVAQMGFSAGLLTFVASLVVGLGKVRGTLITGVVVFGLATVLLFR